jgi:hypothetical protein
VRRLRAAKVRQLRGGRVRLRHSAKVRHRRNGRKLLRSINLASENEWIVFSSQWLVQRWRLFLVGKVD